MKATHHFFNVLILEAKHIFTSVSAMLIIFGGSLFYLFLYPTPYYSDVVGAQKIVIIDNDKTTLSRKFISLTRVSPYIELVDVISDTDKAKTLIEKGEVYGVVIIPQGFERDLYKKIPPKIPIMANASYILIYGAIANAMLEVVNEMNEYVKTQLNKQDYDILLPEFIPLFNPSMGYINYTLAPVLIFILHQTLIAGAGIIGGTQNQQVSQGVFNYYLSANIFSIIIAKILILLSIYLLLFAFYFGFAYQFYGVSVSASVLDFWLFSTGFIISTAAFGVLFGAILPKRAYSTQIIMLASMPLVFLLGFIWSVEQISPIASSIAQCLPAYYGINGLLRLNQMGANFSSVWDCFFMLIFLTIIYVIASFCIIAYKRHKAMSFLHSSRKRP